MNNFCSLTSFSQSKAIVSAANEAFRNAWMSLLILQKKIIFTT